MGVDSPSALVTLALVEATVAGVVTEAFPAVVVASVGVVVGVMDQVEGGVVVMILGAC